MNARLSARSTLMTRPVRCGQGHALAERLARRFGVHVVLIAHTTTLAAGCDTEPTTQPAIVTHVYNSPLFACRRVGRAIESAIPATLPEKREPVAAAHPPTTRESAPPTPTSARLRTAGAVMWILRSPRRHGHTPGISVEPVDEPSPATDQPACIGGRSSAQVCN